MKRRSFYVAQDPRVWCHCAMTLLIFGSEELRFLVMRTAKRGHCKNNSVLIDSRFHCFLVVLSGRPKQEFVKYRTKKFAIIPERSC